VARQRAAPSGTTTSITDARGQRVPRRGNAGENTA